MSEQSLDEINQRILHILQEDARNNTNAEISERVDISPSTVGKRIKDLETDGVVKGYYPKIDYERAGLPLRVLFICTSSITERSELIQQVSGLSGVVNIKELMTGRRNVHIEVVGSDNGDVTRLATAIDDLGIDINEEILVKSEICQPASGFAPDADSP